mgnify:CR=1 FL=1
MSHPKNLPWLMTKRILSLVLLLVVFSGILFYAVLYSRWFPRFLLSQWLKRNWPEVQVQSLTYKKRYCRFFQEIGFEDLQGTLRRGALLYQFHCPRLRMGGFNPLGKHNKGLDLIIEEAQLVVLPFRVGGLALHLQFIVGEDKALHTNGEMKASSLSLGSALYQNGTGPESMMEEISGLVTGRGNQFQLKSLSATGYGGRWQGDISVDDLSRLSYNVDLKYQDVDVQKVRSLNAQFFSKANGKMSGTIRMAGGKEGLKTFVVGLRIHPGGTIKASLLKLIVGYFPQSIQKKDLEDLIKKDGDIPVDKAAFELENKGSRGLTTRLDLESKRLNLDLNLDMDIHTDTPLGDWVQRFTTFLENKELLKTSKKKGDGNDQE